ncbi:LuxR family two component transcriptional regulator [Saccharothrix carnea]|uniref:LuxR family two component transcriptional regulator n=1 Tax=Saccharothrix carnea TaxID=1280637 RepID=A0A2P8IEJ7_SACCR|nr:MULTISPECIES: response regulator transcription factor [Saccharothrix]OKI33175.1 DNA-binding response regulator [Saccharothrix sp. CB00851]PSL56860.1 LuxR family two component transcriptional regulator [Saccharothrix carnea]
MRVILAEDSTLLREGLVRLLVEEGHDVLAAVGDAEALLSAVAAHLPDVVVTDVRMPPTNSDEGLKAALEIRRRFPGVGVLVLSQYVEQRYAVDLLTEHADGVGYLLKDRVVQVEEFLDALRRVGAGDVAFDPEVVRRLLARTSHPLDVLTERERQVLAHMAEGHTNNAIASRLHVSRSAVEKHINSIFDKLGLSDVDGYSRRVLAILRYLRA